MAAFIFDIDGTIIDSMPFHARSWSAFAIASTLRVSDFGAAPNVIARASDCTTLDPQALALDPAA